MVKIAEAKRHVPPQKPQKIFPDVPLQDLIRPREIQLLISHKEGQLVPQKIRSIGDLVLWDGPLGKTIGGTHPDLFEEVTLMAHTSKTHFARSMRAAAFKYQEFTKDLASCQHPDHSETLSTTATSSRDFLKWWSSEPHWHAKYPWVEDPATLPNNRKAVEATFIRTEMKLSKEPEWKTAYAAQVHEMVNRRAAVKLSKEVLQSLTGPVWYISHLIAPNPHSVSTPVRLVWNSSQKYRGLSLNDILIKGPDVLNPIRAVLLRFRAGVYAALGDIRKMYNSVWQRKNYCPKRSLTSASSARRQRQEPPSHSCRTSEHTINRELPASVRGHPRKIWSDPGTNFVGAKPVLEEMYAYLRQQNKESLEEYSAKNETTWAWKILPADSPHRNEAAEAAVRVTKRALHTLGNAEALTFSEFLTALQLAANLANERPIDARIQSREDPIDYITPNNLLLGRATQSWDFKTIDFTNYPFKRLKEVQTMVNNFWRSWSQLAGPNLFIRSKWHTAERNIAVGDIVWLCDQRES
ncbi:unnamed protein product [Oreochromis niloticus]|nr:unnamed protein product [Mustela putorius furo]